MNNDFIASELAKDKQVTGTQKQLLEGNLIPPSLLEKNK
jgi:hypothetical protein